MAEKKLSEGKVYLMVTITVSDTRAFNVWWTKESLPYWLKYAKHVGSWVHWVGGPTNASQEIIRMFEFENMTKYIEWGDWLASSEGRNLMKKITSFGTTSQWKLLLPAPTD